MANDQTRQFIEEATQAIQGGRFNDAMAMLDQAVAIDPADADVHLLRGICFSQTSQPAAATDAFQRAIELDPNSAKANYNLAVHQYAQGQKTEALQSARRAADLDAGHTAARQLISTLETELGGGPVSVQSANDPLSVPPVVPGPATPPPSQTMPEMPSVPPTTQLPPGPLPQGNPYSRQPDFAEPAHSIPFVESLGGAWVGIGWALAVLDLALFIGAIALVFPAISQVMQPGADPNQISERMSHLPGIQVLQIGGWASKILIIAYTVIDLIDRRGNWIWMIPNVICTCCSFGWVTLPIYMLAGRNK